MQSNESEEGDESDEGKVDGDAFDVQGALQPCVATRIVAPIDKKLGFFSCMLLMLLVTFAFAHVSFLLPCVLLNTAVLCYCALLLFTICVCWL